MSINTKLIIDKFEKDFREYLEASITHAELQTPYEPLSSEDESQEKAQNQVSVSLAMKFHRYYEELAPKYGYETREDTKKFDSKSKNGKLMVAVCEKILANLVI